MKKLYALTIVFTLLFTIVHAKKGKFLRIYSINGYKFQKGYFVRTTDSSIVIYKHHTMLNIPVTKMGFIKTNRSVGHDILMEELLIALPFTLLGTEVGAADEVPAVGVGLGVVVGHAIGIPLGVIISAQKERYLFKINGSLDSWRQQRKSIAYL